MRIRKLNANESLMTCRNTTCRAKHSRTKEKWKSITSACLLVMRPPAYRRQDSYSGEVTEHGNSTEGDIRKYLITVEVGRNHSSEDSYGNMAGAKGSGYWANIQNNNLTTGRFERI